MWQLCWSRLLWPSHVTLMDHRGCNLLCGPVLVWLSAGDDLVTYCTDTIFLNTAVDGQHVTIAGCLNEICVAKKKKSKKRKWIGKRSNGLPAIKRRVIMATQNTSMYTDKTDWCTQSGLVFHIYSASHKWMALMFWAFFFSPVSKRFTLCLWCNPFPWDGTCSIKSRKKPFSGMTNTHIYSITYTAPGGWKDLNCT